MADYSNNLCPPGFFCLEGDEPHLCPAGRMRDTPGAKNTTDCPLCRPGYYCPNDTDNTQGIPCRETFECPEGASIEIDCRPGYFCNGTTGDPYICPGGYYCPNATDTPIPCYYPYYCPEGSNMTLTCPLGYKADNPSGIRDSLDKSCSACPAGYYGNDTDRADCYICPAGYYCPKKTHHGTDNPCPIGSYCPEGSPWYLPCPVGMYGRQELATEYADCAFCPENTFNDLEGQQACRTCGSSAYASVGSALCTCRGKYRYFLPSDGSCLCLSGYIYYDEVNTLTTDGDSDQNCQQIVDDSCSTTEVRWANDRACVNPNNVDCDTKCPDGGGTVHVSLGMCQCNTYKDFTEICDITCQATTEPDVTLELMSDGTVTVAISDPVTGTTTSFTKTDIIGPSEVTTGSNKVYVVNFFDTGVAGSVYPDAATAQDILYDLQTLTSTPVVGRRRLLSTTLPANTILNPALCLEFGEIVLFNVWINSTDRTSSHYPVYVKNHLYNSNPSFDYGAFTQLQNLIDNTNASITSFARAFTEAGTFVFADAQEPSWEVIIEVQASGSSCSATANTMMPATATNLVALGVYKQSVANEEPDWGIIIGLIAFFAALVVLLVVAVIVWRPHDSVIYPVKHWKPKYRQLGIPPPVPSYLRYDPDNWPQNYAIDGEGLGPRPGAEGAEAEAIVGGAKKEGDLEDFNVRVLYDKLEDQNLHLASQLARQQEDLEGFYKRICQQNEELKKLLNDLDPEKVAALEARQAAIERDGLQGAAAAAGGAAILNTTLKMGGDGAKGKFAGTRENDLMVALQLLLDKLNTGNIPLSQEVWDKMQRGEPAGAATITNVNISGGATHQQLSGAQGEILRNQNSERLQLERELANDEREAFDNLLHDNDEKRKKITDSMAESLSLKLQGDLKEGEIKEILSQHEKDLQAALDKHNKSREKQMEELRQKLAERRRKRMAQLKEKHCQEAAEVGLPTPVDGADDSDLKLKTEQDLLTTLHSEEASGLAKADMDSGHHLSEEMRRKMSSNMSDQIETLGSQNLITADQAQDLVEQQSRLEADLKDRFEKQRQGQLQRLHDNMEKRRQQRLRALQQQQEKERAELSAQLTQNGSEADKDHMLKVLDLQHQQQREALEVQLEGEENEQGRQLSKALDNDHTSLLKEGHRKLTEKLLASTPQEDRLAAQRILDQFRRDLESAGQDLESEKARQMADIQAKLAARKEKRMRDNTRRLEELSAQKFVSEQTQQMKSNTGGEGQILDSNLHHMPSVAYAEGPEEQALKREQERAKEDIKKRHQIERDQLAVKLDTEAQRQEQEVTRTLEGQIEQAIREKKNRHAAEEGARSDLSQDELAALMAAHAQEVEELAERMENEKTRQQVALRERLGEQRRRRMEELRRRQDAELMSEMLEQRRELDNIKLKKAKNVEEKAIEEGIRQNGEEDSNKVVEAVLAQRHAQEMQDLENEFKSRKKVIVDDSVGHLNQKYDKLRDEMAKRHAQELAALEKQALSPEEKQEKRTELLNRQQMEQAKLERQLPEEQGDIERGALKDWQVEFARARLALKEKHYKEFAEALKEFSPNHQSALAAEASARELENVRAELDKRRKEKEDELKREQEAFEKSENKRIEAEMAAFAKELEEETQQEKNKQQRNIEALNKRKEELIKENKEKLKNELEKMKTNGSSKEEQDRVIKEHEKSVNQLVGKMEADRLRLQSNLQDKLKKRREEKLKNREQEVKDNLSDQKRDMEIQQRNERERLQTDELLTLNETLNVDGLRAHTMAALLVTSGPTKSENQDTSGRPEAPSMAAMPSSYSMTAPLNEAELMGLLMASPLYEKLEAMKKTVANGNFKAAPGIEPGDGYVDDKEASWNDDKELKPVDLNKLNARSFVVYKFGCHIADTIAKRCQHAPLNILLADTVPANPHLSRNMYRNSFAFDANNRILYVRSARLDTVGDYLLVLAHCLAHIKSGDLRDDTNPSFVKEYQKALSVVCDSLFQAKTKRTEQTSPASFVDPGTAEHMLQAMFDNSPSEDVKTCMIEDLLDVKLMPKTARDGAQLTKERMAERISKYSDYLSLNKLQGMLGDLEDKVHQAKGQGSTKNTLEQMSSLSEKFTTAGPTEQETAPPSFLMANMTGTALYQTFENSLDNKDTHQVKPDKTDAVQDKQDKLNADFARISQSLVEQQDKIRELEEEVTTEMQLVDSSKGKDQEKHKALLKAVQEKIAAAKSELLKLTMEKSRIVDMMGKLEAKPSTESDDARAQTAKSASVTAAKPQKKGKK